MPTYPDERDEFESSWDDDDGNAPQARDLEAPGEDETPTVPCPSCGRDIPDFADRCPYCGDWVVQTSGPPARHNLWFVLVASVAILLIVLFWVLRR